MLVPLDTILAIQGILGTHLSTAGVTDLCFVSSFVGGFRNPLGIHFGIIG